MSTAKRLGARLCAAVAICLAVLSCNKSPSPDREVQATRLALGGSSGGTPTDIHTCAELQAMELDLAGSYRLANDVDCTGFDHGDGGGWKPVGFGGTTFAPYTGQFDGAGFTITGLGVNRPSTHWIGLFGLTFNADVHDVGLVDVNLTGNQDVGALIGGALNTTVSECYATGTLTGTHEVGGLIGMIKGSLTVVTDSYSAVAVQGNSTSEGVVIGAALLGAHLQRSYGRSTMTHTAAIAGTIDAQSGVNTSFFDVSAARAPS